MKSQNAIFILLFIGLSIFTVSFLYFKRPLIVTNEIEVQSTVNGVQIDNHIYRLLGREGVFFLAFTSKSNAPFNWLIINSNNESIYIPNSPNIWPYKSFNSDMQYGVSILSSKIGIPTSLNWSSGITTAQIGGLNLNIK